VHDDHVDRARLYLWTAATNGPIVHPPGDIWVWKTVVEWYQQRKAPDSSTRALWQSYQQSSITKQKELAKEMMDLALRSILVHTWKGYLTCRKIFRHGADGFTSPPEEGVLRVFIAPTNPSPSTVFEPANLGSNSKHANHRSTEVTECKEWIQGIKNSSSCKVRVHSRVWTCKSEQEK
jgi:hypothetical protein